MSKKYISKPDAEFIDGYVYFDTSQSFVCWNICHGIICSPGSIGGMLESSSVFSFFFRNKLVNKKHLELELQMEIIREKEFPDKNPRLNSLYFFATEWEAQLAEGLIPSFKKEYLQKIKTHNKSISKYDMNWITYCEYDTIKNDPNWIKKYWNGDICPHSKYGVPIWEHLTHEPMMIPDVRFVLDVLHKTCEEDDLLKYFAYMSNYSGSRMGGLFGTVYFNIEENYPGHIGHQAIIPFSYVSDSAGLIEIVDHMAKNMGKILQPPFLDKNKKTDSLFKMPDMKNEFFCLTCNEYIHK